MLTNEWLEELKYAEECIGFEYVLTDQQCAVIKAVTHGMLPMHLRAWQPTLAAAYARVRHLKKHIALAQEIHNHPLFETLIQSRKVLVRDMLANPPILPAHQLDRLIHARNRLAAAG